MSRYRDWFRDAFHTRRPPARKPRRSQTLHLEMLEDRRMFVMGALNWAAEVPDGSYNGVGELSRNGGLTGSCTASLLWTGKHILTAGHCVDTGDGPDFDNNGEPDGNGQVDPLPFTVMWQNGAVSTKAHVAKVTLHPSWNGDYTKNDIAILTLDAPIWNVTPSSLLTGYDINCRSDEVNQRFTLVGYGLGGSGLDGEEEDPDRTKRWGQNYFDMAVGPSDPAHPYQNEFSTYLQYDLDDPNNPDGLDTGGDSIMAPGDSGGPNFLANGRIAGVTSWGTDPVRLGGTGNVTRVSSFAPWIDSVVGRSRELILDVSQFGGANDGSADTLEARINAYGDTVMLYVNGVLVRTGETCRVDSITILGSNDNDVIKVDGDLARPVTVDAYGGTDRLEVDAFWHGGEIHPTQSIVSLPSVWVEDAQGRGTAVYYYGIEKIILNGGGTVNVDSLKAELIINGSNDGDTIFIGSATGSLDNLALRSTIDGWLGQVTVNGNGGTDKLIFREGTGANAYTTSPHFEITNTGVARERYIPYSVNGGTAYRPSLVVADYSGIEELTVRGASSVPNTVDVVSLPTGTTTINGGNSADTFTVGNSTGSLDALALGGTTLARIGTLAITGGLGADQMIFRDLSPATSPDFTISETKVVRTRSQQIIVDGIPRFTTYTVTADYSGIETVNVNGADGVANTFTVQSTPSGVKVNVFGGSKADQFYVGDVQSSLLGTDSLKLDGKGDYDLLTLDDSGSVPFPTVWKDQLGYMLTSGSLDRYQELQLSFDTPRFGKWISVFFVGMEDVTLRGANDPGTYYVANSSAQTPLHLIGGAAADTFSVGDPDGSNLADMKSNVSVSGQGGFDRLTLDDRSNPAAATGTLVSYSLSNGILNTGGRSFAFVSGDLEDLTLYTTNGPDVIQVSSTTTALPTTIDAGGGADIFSVRLSLGGPLTLKGGTGYDTLVTQERYWVDQKQSYVITANAVGNIDPLQMAQDIVAYTSSPVAYQALEAVEVNGTNFPSDFFVLGTAAGVLTTLNGGNDNDALYVGGRQGTTLDALQGALHFNGLGGAGNSIELNDSGNQLAQNYTLDPTGLYRPGKLPITYYNLSAVSLAGGSSNDVFKLEHLEGGALISLAGNAGSDTLDYAHYDQSVIVDLAAGSATDLQQLSGIENVVGGSGADRIFGNVGDNRLIGGYGNDLIDGRAGNDIVQGGSRAYHLDRELGLNDGGAAYNNWGGLSEKWLVSGAGGWHYITPDGRLWQWDTTTGPGNLRGNLIATLEVDCYYNLSLLYNATLQNPSGDKNVLIGGQGADSLAGTNGEDVLMAGSTIHDQNKAALDAVMAEWSRADLPYANRVDHLLHGGGLNGATLFDPATCLGDSGLNTLTGGDGLDLFFGSKTLDAHDWNEPSGEIFVALNAAPTVAIAAAASANPVTGTTTNLSVLGADDGGAANLTYTWATTGTPPAAVSFSANGTNGAKGTVATFTKAGTYSFTVTISDGLRSTTSSVTVTVNATLTSIAVSPGTATVVTVASQQFTATGKDQFGAALAIQPTWAWSVAVGGGTITSAGKYTAPNTTGSASIRATSGGISSNALVTLVAPTLPSAPSGLAAVVRSSSQIDLTWTDNASNETGFVIERSTDGKTFTQIGSVGANIRTYSATGLSANKVYYFRVRAINSAGFSLYSNLVSAKTNRR